MPRPLPHALREAYLDGKWLVVSRGGWSRCPGMGLPELQMMGNLWASGSYAAVLNADYEVLDVTKVDMEGATWGDAVADARLWYSDGELIDAPLRC